MTEEIDKLYRLLRLEHYRQLFSRVGEKPGSLSATEAFSAEMIYLLGEPTVGEFADFASISQPNASYKVGALVAKGYLEKLTAGADRRETRLRVTEKFRNYYRMRGEEIEALARGAVKEFTDAERAVIARFLDGISAKIIGRGEKNNGLV